MSLVWKQWRIWGLASGGGGPAAGVTYIALKSCKCDEIFAPCPHIINTSVGKI